MASGKLTMVDYAVLADFRHALRRFQAFSEAQATAAGLTPQQHQALLAIKAAPADGATVGFLAERLILKPHSASGLVDRMTSLGLIDRIASPTDRRTISLRLTDKAQQLLSGLSAIHRSEIREIRPLLLELLEKIGA